MSRPSRPDDIEGAEREDARPAPPDAPYRWGIVDLAAASQLAKRWIDAHTPFCAELYRSPTGARALAAYLVVSDEEWQQVTRPCIEEVSMTREERALLIRATRSSAAAELRALPRATRHEVFAVAKMERDYLKVSRLFQAMSQSEAGRGVSRLETWRQVSVVLYARAMSNPHAFGGAWRIADEEHRDLHYRIWDRAYPWGPEESRGRGDRER